MHRSRGGSLAGVPGPKSLFPCSRSKIIVFTQRSARHPPWHPSSIIAGSCSQTLAGSRGFALAPRPCSAPALPSSPGHWSRFTGFHPRGVVPRSSAPAGEHGAHLRRLRAPVLAETWRAAVASSEVPGSGSTFALRRVLCGKCAPDAPRGSGRRRKGPSEADESAR